MSLYSDNQSGEILWFQKYRPKLISECVLSENHRNVFSGIIQNGEIPNLILSGPAGCGKTTIARVLATAMDYEVLFINGSNEGRLIDTLRTKMQQFASSVSFGGGRKLIHIDEADMLPIAVQGAARAFIEDFSSNCSFIFTCNFKNRIMAPIQSRFKVIDFVIPDNERQKMMLDMFRRCCGILDENKVVYEKKVLAEFIKKNFPDFRRILNELQTQSYAGRIDERVLINSINDQISDVCQLMKTKDFRSLREWAAKTDLDGSEIFHGIYDRLYEQKMITSESIPEMSLIMAKYNYQHAIAVDPQINLIGLFTELMMNCTWTS